jgi:hypothetical protein
LQLDPDADKDVGFTGLTYLPGQGEVLAVSGLHGTVWRIDGQLRQARETIRQAPREKNGGARVSL